MKLGSKRPLMLGDLPDLSADDKNSHVLSELIVSYAKHDSKLVRAIWSVHWGHILISAFFKLFNDASQFTGPIFLSRILDTLSDTSLSDKERFTHGLVYAVLIFVCQIAGALGEAQYFQRAMRVGLKIKSALTGMVFCKCTVVSSSLQQAGTTHQSQSVAPAVNLVSQDVEGIGAFSEYGHNLWSAPLRVGVALYMLYVQLGVVVLLALGVILVVVLLQGFVVKRQMGLLRLVQKRTDERVKVQSETIGGIKLVKCYTWEEAISARVAQIREIELKIYKTVSILRGINMFCVSAVPVLIALCVFAAYAKIEGRTVTTKQAFVSLSLFGVLRFPLMLFPSIVNQLATVKVSIARLELFLGNLTKPSTPDQGAHHAEQQGSRLVFEDASFALGVSMVSRQPAGGTEVMEIAAPSPGDRTVLKHLNFTVEPGELVVVVGLSASGKSMLLSALLGHLELVHGRFTDSGGKSAGVCYVPQTPWIFNGTVRENIVLAGDCAVEVDEAAYQQALFAACLEEDVARMPHGDQTEIGERGINLSGGQKARVSLARAFYFATAQTRNYRLMLLDDPLSALDVVVANRVFQRGLVQLCTAPTRVLVTNRLEFAQFADRVVVMDGGTVKAVGKFGDIPQELLPRSSGEAEGGEQPMALVVEGAVPGAGTAAVKKSDLIKSENRATGALGYGLLSMYVSAMGVSIFTVIVLSYVVSEAAKTLSYFFLQSDYSREAQVGVFIGVYGGLSGVQLLGILVAQILVAWGSLSASRKLHDEMFSTLLGATMDWFQTTPLGRIQNRLSKDVYEVDRNVASSFLFCISAIVGLIGTLVTLGIAEYRALLCFLPVLVFFYRIQKFYRASSREIKRIEALSRSPILTLLQQTIDGVHTLVAFQQQQAMIHGPASRLIDCQLRSYFTQFSSNRWLGVRLEFFGGLLVLFVAVAVVLGATVGTTSAGTAGIAIFAALQVTGALGMLVRVLAMTENSFNAVERLVEYADKSKVVQETTQAKHVLHAVDSPHALEFRSVTLRYGQDLSAPAALSQVSFALPQGGKVGIVGRTAAGKTSLVAALFRLHNVETGEIFIDGHAASSMSLAELRSQLSIIPQDPVVFAGTVRYNVDPFDRFNDREVQEVLEKAHLWKGGASSGGAFEQTACRELTLLTDASVLSAGQRQLLCLARVLLQKPKILVLDEATSSLDPLTDSLVQETLEKNFQHTTVLTIAHRLQTVMGCDNILVMAGGKVVEFGSVDSLTNIQGGFFRTFLDEAGMATA